MRTLGLMTTFFVLVDSGRRHFPDQFNKPFIGPFLASGIAGTLAWWLIWPIERMKAQVQGGMDPELSVRRRMMKIIKLDGPLGLYRGILPGSLRSFFANGFSMVVMVAAQKIVSEMGGR